MRLLMILWAVCVFAGCSTASLKVTVSNPLEHDRHPEMAEVSYESVCAALDLADGDRFIVRSNGKEVPYQITSDGKVIFPVTLKAGGKQSYTFRKGTPAPGQTLSCGQQYTDKNGVPQDVAWENDKVGFRLYSKSTSPIAAGYDLFAKRGTSLPVLEGFYAKNLDNSPAWDKYYELLDTEGKEAALKYKRDSLSFHIDRGYGLDCYQVGPTLGAGVAALFNGNGIIYPGGYESFEIIENGPLRFQTKFTFAPRVTGKDSCVVETRIITLDAGSQMNHTSVRYRLVTLDKNGHQKYEDLSDCGILTGIVLREKGGECYQSENYISYPSPTQVLLDEWVEMKNGDENGTLYIGHIFPEAVRNTCNKEGHLVAISGYDSERGFQYYWGFGWDKAGMETHQQWNSYLERYALQIKSPITIKMK